MIVAIYANAFSIVLPVNPVNQINRLTPEGRKQNRSKQTPYSFATLLSNAMAAKDPEDERSFDALA